MNEFRKGIYNIRNTNQAKREREGEETKKQENCNRVYKNSATKLKKPRKIEKEVNRERQRRKGRRRGAKVYSRR